MDELLVIEGIESIAQALSARNRNAIADAVLASWGSLDRWMTQSGARTLENECYRVSRTVLEALKERNVESKILAGDVKLRSNDYLEHRVNIIHQPELTIVVDLASRQFNRDSDGLLVLAPTYRAVKDWLQSEYSFS